jgi:hypothetical protein
MTPITPQEALQILSDALQPSMQGQITRAGYLHIEQAIQTLASAIKPQPTDTDANYASA